MALLLAGNLLMGRSFAYWGIQSAKLFIGELSLAAFVLAQPSAVFGTWFRCLGTSHPASAYAWMFLIFVEYGIFQFLRGITAGHSFLFAIQNLAFNLYPLYLFVGGWIGTKRPDLLPSMLRSFAWVHGIYGLLYIFWLNRLDIAMPGAAWVTLFGQPAGSAVILLGLFCFERRLSRVMIPLVANAFILLGMQLRAEWLAFLFGISIWGLVTKRLGDVLRAAAVVPLLLLIGYVVNFDIPAPAGRGANVSTRGLIGRAIAPVNENLAAEVMGREARGAAATYNWRVEWWRGIWKTVHADPTTTAIGLGYGFPLWSVTNVSMPNIPDAPVRTPHSVFYYTLGYTGWIGVLLFGCFQLQLFRLLWRAYRRSGQPFGLVACTGLFAWAFFDAAFEAPYRAIPYFLIAGVSIGPILTERLLVPVKVCLHSRRPGEPPILVVPRAS